MLIIKLLPLSSLFIFSLFFFFLYFSPFNLGFVKQMFIKNIITNLLLNLGFKFCCKRIREIKGLHNLHVLVNLGFTLIYIEILLALFIKNIIIDLQMDAFKNARGLFGMEVAVMTRTKKSPASWWDSYGDECLELKRFAIRILSLTCSSSGCERNWSAFEMVHTKRRNRLHQQKMNDLVFIMYNLKLKRRYAKRASSSVGQQPIALEDIPSGDEWIAKIEEPVLPKDGAWLNELDRATRRFTRASLQRGDASQTEEESNEIQFENVEVQELSDNDVLETFGGSNELGVGDDDVDLDATITGTDLENDDDDDDGTYGFDE